MMKTAAIIQARMGSSRLPGKIMLKVCGKTFLEHMIERVKKSKKIDEIIIATTDKPSEDVIVDLCKNLGVLFFRGPEEDVLARYKLASDVIGADIIVRLTSDNPLVDFRIIDEAIQIFQDNEYDFVSNYSLNSTTYPHGFAVEVFSAKVLNEAHEEAKKPSDREHVVFFTKNQPKRYKIFQMNNLEDLSNYRVTLDYNEDYLVIKAIFEGLYPSKNDDFSMSDVISWLDDHPEVKKLNSKIKPYLNILKSFEDDKKKGYF